MDYSAPIIYHYFKDKKQLLSYAVQEGYSKLLLSSRQPDPSLPPDEQLRLSFHYFVEEAMQVPKAYRAFILNYSSNLLAESSVLGASGEQSPTLSKLISIMEKGIEQGLFAPCDVALTAKVWWSATFGLFFRFIVEPDIVEAERKAFIDRQVDIMLKGISA
jgi:AcrR family transcriptional regulator